MPATATFPPDPPHRRAADRDPALASIIEALSAMPPRQRNAILVLVQFLLSLPWQRRAVLAKAADPNLSDKAVAHLAGVCSRHLVRNEDYKALKQTIADFLLSLPRRDHTRTKRRNGRPMPNPGEDAGDRGFSDPNHCDG